MTEHNHAHLQTRSAIWGQLPGEAQTLTAEGSLSPTANPFAVAFSEDLHLFAGLSGTEDFFELREEKEFSVVSIFDDEDVRDSFQRTDFKLVRTAVLSNETLWDTLTERTIPRFDEEGAGRYVCELLGDNERCGIGLRELEKVHGASNTQQERQPRHQIPIGSISYHESMCKLWQHICRPFHSGESCCQFVVQRHVQDRSQSHDLGTGGDHTSNQLQPLRARIWRFANETKHIFA